MLSILNKLAKIINRLSEYIGRTISWAVLLIVLLVIYDVVMRYFFKSGSIAIQELEWHLFSILFLFGAAYAHQHDAHVRMDLFYQSQYLNDVQRAWIDIIGNLLLLLPFCVLIIFCAWPFVMQSFSHAEISPDPGGLPYRWILKACIPIGFMILALQALATSIEKINIVFGHKR